MKKFTRILVFLLVLATLASLFAVSAFASEEEIPSSVAVDYAAKWEGKEKDDFIGIDESYKGNVYVGVSDDGNRYGIFETKESEASSNNKLEEELSAAPSVKDYPYAVIDFDIMTPGGAYETDIIISFFVNTANKYLANVKVSAFSNFLDSVAGEWQHVTVIMQRCCDIDDEGKIASFNLKFSYFVDGVKVCETEGNKLSSMNGFDAAATGFSQVRFVIPSVFSENEKTAFDNVAINYFAENSTEEEMAGVVYGEDYELPYGNTVAKIGETVYDDINKAVAAASAGDKITLFADVAEPVQIDKNIKVDTQKGAYRFAYTTDGKRDADNQEGIYVFYYLDTAYAAVNWVDADGNVLATTKAIKGEIAEMPLVSIYTEADLYRDILIQNWINADGEENYVIGYEDSYTFTAVAPEINENTKYVANLKDLQFNVAYYAQFVCYFYLPVEASMQAPVVSGFDPAAAETVYIHDIEYWCYANYCTTANIFENKEATVEFTIDGVTYSQDIQYSGLLYAEIIANDSASKAKEKNAVANMVRFVDESLKAAEIVNEEINARIEALIGEEGKFELSDYIADDEYLDLDATAAGLEYYIKSIHFKMEGSYAAYVFELTEAGATANISVVNSEDKEIVLSRAGAKKLWTLNLKVYDAIKTLTITVEDGENTLSANYSVGAYINAADSDLVRALYAFGVAAEDYRNSRRDY